MDKNKESMPCPRCKTKHERGKSVERPDLQKVGQPQPEPPR